MNALLSRARRCAQVFACVLVFVAGAAPAPAAGPTAVEYYHSVWGHYFITTDPREIEALDGRQIMGWTRTQETFEVDGLDRVCRYMGWINNKITHFYSPWEHECLVLQGFESRLWTFEGWVFGLDTPDLETGLCPGRSRPLYRLYNNGSGGAPNHRYTIRWGLVQMMAARGWVQEGFGPSVVFACVPDSGDEGPFGGPWTFVRQEQRSPNCAGLVPAQPPSTDLQTVWFVNEDDRGDIRFEYSFPAGPAGPIRVEGPSLARRAEGDTVLIYQGCFWDRYDLCWEFTFDKPRKRTATLETNWTIPYPIPELGITHCTLVQVFSGRMNGP